ncbi:SprT-like domain-containing protein [Salinicoccus roseus]|uniref:SprT-like domain-containing protein n=1 Tax=Salinicoccus roseus TaxID=45670 RepID=UPI00211B25AD|nr:SprT-like domain-containing protein [Salinicoccus roseus]
MEQIHLERHADAFLRREFGMPLDIPIRISKRMKSKLGAFRIKYIRDKAHDKEMEIVMSHTFIRNNPTETILGVLYHKCVHYALFTKNQFYRDSDTTFIRTLDRLGISRTRTHMYRGEGSLYECRKYQFSRNMIGYEKRYVYRRSVGGLSMLG